MLFENFIIFGRKRQVINSHGTTTYEYDAEGNVTQIDSPEGTVNYEYNSITGSKRRTYSSNTDTGYSYDELGRLKEVQTGSQSATYYYDEVGNRDYMELELNGSPGYEIKTDYTYDNLNRLTDLIQQKTGAIQLASYNYQLKDDGMRHSLDENFPANEDRNIVYTYDNLNRLQQEDADSSGNGYACNYAYDLADNRTQRIVNVNGQTLTTIYLHDPNTDQLIKETHSGPVYSLDAGNEQYYAYTAGGKSFYYRDLHGNKVGPVQAFFLGLPSVWSRYLFVLLILLLPVMLFGPAVVGVIRRLVYCYGRPTRLRIRVPRKGICLLIAFVMLFGPEEFHSLAQANVQYANLSTATWAQGDTTIEYTYDANGSVETKTTKVTSTQAVKETIIYDYNLRNRLAKVTTEDENGDKHIAEYIYNDEGIRVRSYTYDVPYGQGIQNEKTVVYLVDEYNHTGYAQTLEEKTYNGTDTSGVPDSLTTYLIGEDVIAQTVDGATQYLLYDGQGSTRQLAEYNGSVTVAESYSYDGYGVLLQDDSIASSNPGKVSQQDTSLLYTGEHFDTDSQQYYLRARYYDPLNGRFNKLDPFSGNIHDPQSLHKYTYCHNNPINATDPTGNFATLTGTIAAVSIQSVTFSIMASAVAAPKFFAQSVITLKNIFSYLMQWDTWKTAGQFVLNGIWHLLANPGQLVLSVVMGLLAKIFVIYGLVSAVWDGIKTLGMLGSMMTSKSYQLIAVILAATIITIGVMFIVGKIIQAGGKVGAKLGQAKSKNYRDTFFEANTDLDPDDIVVHHAVEKQTLTKYPGVVSEAEIHSLENLRGMTKELNSEIHLSKIRKMWNEFYRKNPNTITKEQLLKKATEIDDIYGHLFDPPMR